MPEYFSCLQKLYGKLDKMFTIITQFHVAMVHQQQHAEMRRLSVTFTLLKAKTHNQL